MTTFLLEPPPVSHETFNACGNGQWWCTFSTDSLLSSAIAIVVTLLVVGLIAYRSTHGVPGWLQLGLETLFSFVRGRQVEIDKDAAIIVPIGMTIFLYILIANWIAFLPLPGGIHPANSDLNQTLAMGLLVFVLTQWYSFKVLGVKGYLYRMTRPFDAPLYVRIPFVFLNIIEDLAKPLTLSLRLFGNIFGGLIMLWVLTSLLPGAAIFGTTAPATVISVIFTVGWKIFDVGLIGAIQALIFMLLTIIYFEQAREGADHNKHLKPHHPPLPAIEGGTAQ